MRTASCVIGVACVLAGCGGTPGGTRPTPAAPSTPASVSAPAAERAAPQAVVLPDTGFTPRQRELFQAFAQRPHERIAVTADGPVVTLRSVPNGGGTAVYTARSPGAMRVTQARWEPAGEGAVRLSAVRTPVGEHPRPVTVGFARGRLAVLEGDIAADAAVHVLELARALLFSRTALVPGTFAPLQAMTLADESFVVARTGPRSVLLISRLSYDAAGVPVTSYPLPSDEHNELRLGIDAAGALTGFERFFVIGEGDDLLGGRLAVDYRPD